jgi:membrane protease YdiL (CAAX protease family)
VGPCAKVTRVMFVRRSGCRASRKRVTRGGGGELVPSRSVLGMRTLEQRPSPRPQSSVEPRLGLGPVGITVRVVVAVAFLFGANFLIAGLYALIGMVPALAGLLTDTTPAALALFVLLQAAMLGTVLLLVWAWLRLVERRRLRDAGWRWTAGSPGWLLLAAVVAGGLVFAVVAALPATGPVVDLDDLGPATPTAFALVALVSQAFLLQGIPEELLFRGWLLWALRARPVLAIAVTTLSFTVIHLASSGGQESLAERLLYLALPFGFSLLAVGLMLWTRTLWSAVGVHGGFHLGNAAAVVFLPQVDAALSWVLIGGVQSALGLVLIVTALRRGRRLFDAPRVSR